MTGRLGALEEQLATLQVTNARLVEEVTALRQDQGQQRDLLAKIERELRRARRWRLIGALLRWLIVLAFLAAIFYFFGDWLRPLWFEQWQKLRQLLV